ncbi:hypothetical protein MKW98_009001 [Papaver atlanticum]|uniref:Morc S5 domain-containing protein n=1 Tax=Papaver atlanticum TaxID=357466 RepID=A0AAD4RXH2_9MAGN|nr:hypothetical protein MKW98_009001 [Papaver atlanticum]
MVEFIFNKPAGKFTKLLRSSEEHFSINLSMLLKWSPYKTETELMKQFDSIGNHGTKFIIYNLLETDDGENELDFYSDTKDIQLPRAAGAPKVSEKGSSQTIGQEYISNQLLYSLREYLSILYLRPHPVFRIILRGEVVKHHNIADDIKFHEFIRYKPRTAPDSEVVVVKTIGFPKEAPHVNTHGFSVYHKNRLIIPFWRVLNDDDHRGNGVVGVLEADFIEPTLNKQGFKKTAVLEKLELRLKQMTLEYWDLHCGLILSQQLNKKLLEEIQDKKSNEMSRITGVDSPKVGSEGGLFQCHAISLWHFQEKEKLIVLPPIILPPNHEYPLRGSNIITS